LDLARKVLATSVRTRLVRSSCW